MIYYYVIYFDESLTKSISQRTINKWKNFCKCYQCEFVYTILTIKMREMRVSRDGQQNT